MKVYVLAIVAVFFLSLGFSAYRNSEASHEAALEIARQRPARTSLPTPAVPYLEPMQWEDVGADETLVVAGNDRLREKPVAAITDNGRRTQAKVRERRVRSRASEPALFADTVIYYRGPSRSNLSEAVSRSSVAVADEEPARKGKSALSKTFSAIKQPYKWVKALASKFD